MSEKTLKGAIYFLAAVTGLYLLTALLGRDAPASGAAGSDLADILANADEASATWVEIAGPEGSVRLERAGQTWTVNGFPADSAAVARFWSGVRETEVASVAATNPANHERLGVTAETAWRIEFGDQGSPILLGNAGSRFRTSYARLPDEDAVHLLSGDLHASATRTVSDWRDKVVMALDTSQVAQVRVRRDAATHTFDRQDSTWTVNGADADASMVASLLQELAAFTATGFAADSIQMKASPDRSVTALDAFGAEIASLALDEGDGSLRAQSSHAAPRPRTAPHTVRADRDGRSSHKPRIDAHAAYGDRRRRAPP